MIPNLPVGDLMIDCANAERARSFYAALVGGEVTAAYGRPALKTLFDMMLIFDEPRVPYVPPVWPEEPDAQQKQMHLDVTADDVQAAVERAIGLGATRAAAQYGGAYHTTMLDTEGHPFCICKRVADSNPFSDYYGKMGWGAIPDLSVNIDCRRSEVLRAFYARLTDWDQGFHETALIPGNRMVVHFMGCEGDFDYTPPVYPPVPNAQQGQMRFIYRVKDAQSAAEEAIRAGAVMPTVQCYEGFTTLIDTEGHPFCFASQ